MKYRMRYDRIFLHVFVGFGLVLVFPDWIGGMYFIVVGILMLLMGVNYDQRN